MKASMNKWSCLVKARPMYAAGSTASRRFVACMSGLFQTLRPMLLVVWVLLSSAYSMQCTRGDKMTQQINWGNPTEGLTISVALTKDSFAVGEDIELTILMKNVSKGEVPIVERSAWLDYRVFVLNERGGEIRLLPYAERMKESATAGSRSVRPLLPDETVSTTLDLCRGYDLGLPGTCRVFATRETYKLATPDQFATVRSNELKFRVVPRK